MKIVHVYKDYAPVPGGIEAVVQQLAEGQAAAGHEVTVLVCARRGPSTVAVEQGVTVRRAHRYGTVASMPLSLAQPAQFRRLPADLVHVHSPYPLGEIATLFARRPRLVISHHADVTKPMQQRIMTFYRPWQRLVYRRAARVLVASPTIIETSPILRAQADKCRVVSYGVYPERFQPGATVREDGRTILFCGQLRHYKGLSTLLEAAAQLPEAQVRIVGSGPEEARLKAQVAELQLGERVTFVGAVSDEQMAAEYAAADLFVLPSSNRAEAFGIVLLEAMTSGLPCVTTEVGTGTSYVVQDEVTGFVVPPNEPAALAGRLGQLLADPDLRARLAAAGRARAADFTVATMCAGVQAVYDEVLAERP